LNQILSQEEVDALLNGIKSGDVTTESTVKDNGYSDGCQPFDFIKNNRRMKGSFPAVDMVHEVFCRKLRTTISSLFGKIIENISLRDSRILKYKDFLRSIQLPASFHVIRMNPLRGLGLIVLDSKLAFSFIDCLLGGRGDSTFTVEDREFTTIEQSLIKKLNVNITADLQKSWVSVYPLKIEEVSTETNPQFVSICFPSDMVMVTSIDVDILGALDICVPMSILEPLRGKFSKNLSGMKTDVDVNWRKMMLNQLVKTKLDLKVELGEVKITGKQLISLRQGDVIFLKNGPSDEFPIFIEGKQKLRGTPGSMKGNKAIQVMNDINTRRLGNGRKSKRK